MSPTNILKLVHEINYLTTNSDIENQTKKT